MTREQMVLNLLKPKVKAFGFNQKELKGIAAKIANNLTSAEDASEEDVNAEIESQIEAAIPFLQFAQSQASRTIEEWRKKHEVKDDEDDEDDDEPLPSPKTKASKKNPQPKNEENEQMKQLVDMVAKLTGEISSLKQEKTTDSRKTRLEKLLKDTGTFGTRTLKCFSNMRFESDDEFEDFYAEVEDDLKAYNQERADNGLGFLGTPPAGGSKTKEKEEPFSDDQIAEMAESF